MKTKDDITRAFIDLAKLGRTDWRATASTILLSALVSIIGTLGILMFSGWTLYFKNFDAARAAISLYTNTASTTGIIGFWLACKIVLRRPYLSLISVDLRFKLRRCLFGAVLYLPAFVISAAVMSIYTSIRIGTWTLPFGHLQLLQEIPGFGRILGMLAAWFGILVLAFAEELFFRGWLTQTLGQYVRSPLIVVAIVAALFAIYHTQYDWPIKTTLFFCSLGFSALSLRDQRLELSIGAHTMMNICAMMLPILFTHAQPHAHISTPGFVNNPGLIADAVVFAILKGVLPFALMYWLLKKTNGWFVSKEAASAVGAQRV
ncbi:CPBP family intramembrane glutamic endopeptidase [Streptomyces noursei]|uniref:CPBP family intramembrane metalloprotease n=1 Tax=Burkholderia contaminans TaxID=488447 RepID=A0AAP4R5M9_9BURK|nr:MULTISPECIES: CPBP family intramembrane glutamic endopeptidase [Burkholderia]MBD1411510.1 CPBP family intramembrane metalloprotease [Burkholderia contaminans]MBH9671336.1 CPBP family intramembrane metalloprotease [Burkholderia contaminans]MBH9678529.1 CPBP family intramembrane metalloprotease [Burkholderia contaminans]MBH9708744.1 CPBP family intramembrane metalloprotease [Burkholderia contaminans]MBH9723077.1 CPBP family intramembrane metalloprotease [Burkholderia contaminans]